MLAGCGSSTSSSSQSIAGLYNLQEQTTASTCPTEPVGKTGTDTLSVSTSGGQATETIASIPGSCTDPIDGDQVEWQCQITGPNGTVTLQISATFSGSGISGTAVIGGSCQVTLSFTGTRQ